MHLFSKIQKTKKKFHAKNTLARDNARDRVVSEIHTSGKHGGGDDCRARHCNDCRTACITCAARYTTGSSFHAGSRASLDRAAGAAGAKHQDDARAGKLWKRICLWCHHSLRCHNTHCCGAWQCRRSTPPLGAVWTAAIGALVCLTGLMFGDPGVITRSEERCKPIPHGLIRKQLLAGQGLSSAIRNYDDPTHGSYCVRCLIWRRAADKAHHCSICQRCGMYMCTLLHQHKHTNVYTHTRTQTSKSTNTRIHKHTYTHACEHIHTHAHIYTYSLTITKYEFTHVYMHICEDSHLWKHTYTCE